MAWRKNRERFRETRAVFAKCIITKIVIWLFNRFGLCLKRFCGGALQNICSERQVVMLRPDIQPEFINVMRGSISDGLYICY